VALKTFRDFDAVHPLVSICLPSLNTRPFLGERMASILAQTVTNWELIVCDSYSTDGSWEYLRTFANDTRVKLFQVPKEGIYAGWNECLSRACGEYIYIATSDDTASPNLLERMVGVLEKNLSVELTVCGFDFIDEQGYKMNPPPFQVVGSFYDAYRDQLHQRAGLMEFLVHLCLDVPSWTTIASVVFRRRLLDKVGLFRTDCGTCADRLWAMKAALATDTISLPDHLATWRKHPAQASWVKPSLAKLRRNADLSFETLMVCEPALPAHWKTNSGWRDRILRNVRGQYLKAIGLDRLTLRKNRTRFLKGFAYACVHEPQFLYQRLASGLSWKDAPFGDEEEFLRRIITDWKVPWPPKYISE